VKSLVALTTPFLLLMLCGCGAISKAISERPAALNEEAASRAKDHWKLTEIGGSTYLCVTKHAGAAEETIVIELRNVNVQVLPHSLSEAEKLNGTEWAGAVRLNSDAHRGYIQRPFPGAEASKTWGNWVSRGTGVVGSDFNRKPEDEKEMDTVTVTKIKGHWEVKGHDELVPALAGEWLPNPTFKQVELSDLPK
jgi:hypothetical protein